jgi:hypothetical protein
LNLELNRQSAIGNVHQSAIFIMDELFRAIPKILQTAGASEAVYEAAAFAAWRKVTGETFRTNAVPFRLYQKNLIVAVPDAAWQKQLEELSSQLIFRINSLLGQAVVTFIEFRIDPMTVKRERAKFEEKKMSKEEHELRAMQKTVGTISKAAQEIKNENLRRRFLIAAGSYLERREEE